MLFRTDDPERDFLRDDVRKETELEKMPVCSYCEEHIQGEWLFDIHGILYCEECAFDLFREDVADYVE